MGKLSVFNFVTLDGYFEGPEKGDISWHKHGEEEGKYAAEGLGSGNTLLFGRVTYEFMASYWPTPMAMENDPVVARGMNDAEKIVFSRTLTNAEWENTRIISENIVEETRELKEVQGKNLTLLGSGSILPQFADVGLIDAYQFMVDPVAIGRGTSILNGLKNKLDLKLTETKTFESGVVLLCYQPAF